MANYATNIFHARTENKTDLDKIEAFLDDTFSEFTNRYGDSVDAEFSSRWVYPEEVCLFYKRHTDGTIVGDFDNKITVRFICGKERVLNTVMK